MPLVSVILPTRDRPQLLGRALDSLLAQHEVDFEVVLVDNNQTTPAVLAQPGMAARLQDRRIRVVEARSASSAAAARNVGLAAAQGEWVSFLDDDDEYLPDKLVRQLALAQATGAPLVLCGAEVVLAGRRRRIQVGSEYFSGDGRLLDAIWGTPYLFVRRDPALRFDETLQAGEDLVFAQACIQRLGLDRVPCVPAVLVRVHPQPGTRVNLNPEAHQQAGEQVLRLAGETYSAAARRRFRLRLELQAHKGPGGSWGRLLASGIGLLRVAPRAEARRVLNAWLHRTGWFKRRLVS